MLQKDYVNSYLSANFERIQKARELNGFSWKPIVEELIKLYPEIGLDPNNSGHRDRVRNNFINIRKRSVEWREKTMNRLEQTAKKQFAENLASKENPKYIYVDIKPKTFEFKGSEENFKYLDTYNTTKTPPTNDQEEFILWKREKDKIKNQQGMHIVVGCIHLPAVNDSFFNAFLKFLGDAKGVLKGIHLIGDVLDCKALSQHDNGQIIDTTLSEEYEKSNKYLDKIDALLRPGVEKNYLWGNHEQRYERIIKRADIAKFGGALLSPTVGGKFQQRGYTIQEDYKNAKIQLGKYLDLVHGEYITANASKKHLDIYKKSIMFAHTHKMGAHFDGDKAAFNIGWMGNKEDSAFSYCSRIVKGQWQNGFAVVNIDADGFYHVQLVQWYNGRFVFGTMEYTG